MFFRFFIKNLTKCRIGAVRNRSIFTVNRRIAETASSIYGPGILEKRTEPSRMPGAKKTGNRPFPTYRTNSSRLGVRRSTKTASQRWVSFGRRVRKTRSRIQRRENAEPRATDHRN